MRRPLLLCVKMNMHNKEGSNHGGFVQNILLPFLAKSCIISGNMEALRAIGLWSK